MSTTWAGDKDAWSAARHTGSLWQGFVSWTFGPAGQGRAPNRALLDPPPDRSLGLPARVRARLEGLDGAVAVGLLIVGSVILIAAVLIGVGLLMVHFGAHDRLGLGLALITVAVTLLFRWAPRRRQPRLSWLAFGAGVSVLLWAAVTIALGVFYHFSSSFGQTYGPLAGLIALMLWCLFSAMALLFGAAVAAQLESVRTGQSAPRTWRRWPSPNPRPIPGRYRSHVVVTGASGSTMAGEAGSC